MGSALRASLQVDRPSADDIDMLAKIAGGILLVGLGSVVAAGQRPSGRVATPPGGVRSTIGVSLAANGITRRYLLHVGDAVDRGRRVPLVLIFHGGSDTPEHTEQMTGFSALADREGIAVAYPEGIDKGWADGRGATPADIQQIDDVAFTRAMISDIQKRQGIDAKRIYAAGPSNGGIMVHRLGCDAADVFAAIGPVIAGLASNLVPRCRPATAVSVAAIQGVDDPVVPFRGGIVGADVRAARGGAVEGSRATEAFWSSINGCDRTPLISRQPPRIKDGTSVVVREYSGCRDDAGVAWYEIAGGGHRWPPSELAGPGERFVTRKLGISSRNLDATAVLWRFFQSHPKR
ncbi:MAG: hydrolase [Cyanobacteria bacterium]|nr:hydrolase [Cyanobacteriota bacterium]